MKRILAILALAASAGFGQSNPANVQKGGPAVPSTQISNGNITVGSGTSLTPTGSGIIVATSVAGGGSVPYTDIASVPTVSLIGNPTGGTANASAITLTGDLKFTGTTLDTIQPITISSSPTFAALTLTAPLTGANGGTGVANSGKTITLGGNLTTSGNYAVTLTYTGNTSVTFPTSGTLATTGGTVDSIAGTANQITASASTGSVTLSIPSTLVAPGTITATGGVYLPTTYAAGGAGFLTYAGTTPDDITALGYNITTNLAKVVSTEPQVYLGLESNWITGGNNVIESYINYTPPVINGLQYRPFYADFNRTVVTAGSFTVGVSYTIVSAGTTNFVAIGAANNNPGTVFTSTGVGSGTGTASPYAILQNDLSGETINLTNSTGASPMARFTTSAFTDYVPITMSGAGLGMAATGNITTTNNTNAGLTVAATNANTGTGAYVNLGLGAGTANTNIYVLGSGYTTSGRFIAGHTLIDAGGAGGAGFDVAVAGTDWFDLSTIGIANFPGTASAASSITGTITVGNGTAATNVGIGAGNVVAGGTVTGGGLAETLATFKGTVTLTAGAGTITSAAISSTSCVMLTRTTISGTGTYPQIDAGSGSATITGLSTDNGTYNWRVMQ